MKRTSASFLLLALCLSLADAFVLTVVINRPTFDLHGAVYSTDGFLNCGYNLKSICKVEFARGTKVTLVGQAFLTAKLQVDNNANAWNVKATDTNFNNLPEITKEPNTCSPSAKTCILTMDRDLTVTVSFERSRSNQQDNPNVESLAIGETINVNGGGIVVVRSADHYIQYVLSHPRILKNVTWECNDGIVRVASITPSSNAVKSTEQIRPKPALPKFGFCLAKAVWDNTGRGALPTTINHEFPFVVRNDGGTGIDFESYSESDVTVEGITLFKDTAVYFKELKYSLAGGETFKRKLPLEDIVVDSSPYVTDSAVTIRGGAGSGTLLVNIGYILPSSSLIDLGSLGNVAQVVIDPGDTRSHNIRRVFDVWKGNVAPQVVIIVKNVGIIGASKRDIEQTATREFTVGPLVTNFVEAANAPVKVVENKFVHTFDFANSIPVKPN